MFNILFEFSRFRKLQQKTYTSIHEQRWFLLFFDDESNFH